MSVAVLLTLQFVIPAKAGIQLFLIFLAKVSWTPACAGVTK